MVSPRPSWASLPVDDHRRAAELRRCRPRTTTGFGWRSSRRCTATAWAGERGVPVRSAFSRRRAPAPRPARPGSGRRPAGSAAVIEARLLGVGVGGVQDAGQRGDERVGLRRWSGSAAAPAGPVGAGALMMNPARAAPAPLRRPTVSVEHDADAAGRRRGRRSTSGWPSSSTAVAMCLPSASTWSSRPSARWCEHGQRGRGADRVAGECGAVLAGLQQVAPRPRCRCTRRSAGRRRGPWPA